MKVVICVGTERVVLRSFDEGVDTRLREIGVCAAALELVVALPAWRLGLDETELGVPIGGVDVDENCGRRCL